MLTVFLVVLCNISEGISRQSRVVFALRISVVLVPSMYTQSFAYQKRDPEG